MNNSQTASPTMQKLKKPPARRFLVFVVMVLSWAQIWIGTQTIANYGTQIMSDLSISNATLSLISQGVSIALALAALLAPMLGKRIGGKRTLEIGLVINAIAGLLFFANPTDVGVLVGIRLIEGFGAGFINAYAISLINAWFPKKERGTVNGLWNGLYGIAISSTALFIALFNSMNLTWSEGCGTFVTVAPLVCLVLCLFLYKDIDKVYGVSVIDDALEPDLNEGEVEQLATDTPQKEENRPSNYKQLFKSVPFWMILLCIACETAGSFNLPFCFPFMPVDWGYSEADITLFLSMAFTGTIIAAPLGGFISDRLFHGQRAQMIVIGFAWTIISIIIFLIAGGAHVPMPLLIVVAILCYCGPFVAIGPMYAVPPEIIAPDFFTNANGVILFCCNMFGIANAILSGFLADATGTYATGLIATCVFSVLGLVCAFVLIRRYKV